MAVPKLDASFIRPFAVAAMETLKVQCSIETKAGSPFLKGTKPEINAAIAGVIGLVSEKFKGSIAISFPLNTFLKVMGGMLGEEFGALTKDLEDGAAELMNIIFGCAKKTLSEQGHVVDRAIPSIIKGTDIKLKQVSKAPIIVLPMESDAGPFQIEIVLE